MKKKILTALLSGGALAILIPATSFAAPAKTDITGVITDNGSPVANAKVTVECNSHAKKDTTDASGSYLVEFSAANCPVGATVHVIAKHGQKGGFSQKTVTSTTTKLNVAVVNVSLPELGTVTSIAAMTAVGGGLLVIRRQKLGAQQK